MLQQENNRLHAGRLTQWTWTQVLLHSVHLKQLLRRAERQLLAHLKAHEDLKALWLRLQTIPGIGELTAAALIAYIGDITCFGRVGALVSLAGLGLKQQESGSSVWEPACIDRHGHGELRRLLYWCAIPAMRTDPTIATWAQRLRDRGKPEKVVIVAVMRKLIHIVFGVWKTQTPYDPTKVLGAAA
jgi:transposase